MMLNWPCVADVLGGCDVLWCLYVHSGMFPVPVYHVPVCLETCDVPDVSIYVVYMYVPCDVSMCALYVEYLFLCIFWHIKIYTIPSCKQ